MIYAFRWEEGWVKVGYVDKDPIQRASEGWWENSHPTQLCKKLGPPYCEFIGLWKCENEADEKRLHEQFNEGILKHNDSHNEFYEILEWPKIYRDLMMYFEALPLPEANYPPPVRKKSRKECCGGRKYFCRYCPAKFDKSWNWLRHLREVHRKRGE